MCLSNVNLIKTEKLRLKKKFITGWKVVVKDNGYFSPYFKTQYAVGRTVTSNRKSIKLTSQEWFYREINRGIHVFTTRKKAREFTKYKKVNGRNFKILRVSGVASDLIGIGDFSFGRATGENSAAFMKVRVMEESH